jgi:CRISPR/Cas system CMR-associated protein Cmr5 small subunit
MESLKRKLSTTRRPEPTTRNLLPELNQYKQNNAALQTQIGSLMAKLNESRRNEKSLKTTLQEVEQKCHEWEEKASAAEKLAKNTEALQNSIDHLEHRLEMANIERLDAQEELFNLQMHKSPFDAKTTPRTQRQSTAQKEVRVSKLQSRGYTTVSIVSKFSADHSTGVNRTRSRRARKHKHRILDRFAFRQPARD